MLGDKGYDVDWFRAALAERKIAACMPSQATWKTPIDVLKEGGGAHVALFLAAQPNATDALLLEARCEMKSHLLPSIVKLSW
jgi:hypothetical protein